MTGKRLLKNSQKQADANEHDLDSTHASDFELLQLRVEELHSSEQDLLTLFNSVYDAVFIHDFEGKIVDVNDSMLSLYNLTREQALSYDVFDFCTPGDMVERVRKNWTQLESGGKNITFEGTSRRSDDQSTIDVEIRIHRLNWKGVDRIVAVVKDITDRKQAELAHQKDEARLEALLRLAQMANTDTKAVSDFVLNQAISLTSSQIGFLALVDEDQETITMYSWLPDNIHDFETSDARTVHSVDETGLLGEVVRQQKPIITNDYVDESQPKEGLPIGHVQLHRYLSVPVLENELVYAFVGVGNKENEYDSGDVRQLSLLMEGMLSILLRKRDEDKIRENEAFLQTILANTPIPLYYKDTNGIYQGCNKAFAALQKVEPEDLIGRTLYDLKSEAPKEQLNQADLLLFKDQCAQRFEVTEIDTDGKPRHLMLHKTPYYDLSGNLKGLIGAILDLTEAKANEEALRQKSEELDRYFTTSLDLLCIADTEGHFVRLNNEWEKVLGYQIFELLGHPFIEFVHPDDVEATIKATANLASGVEVTNFVNRYRCKSGEYRWIEWRSGLENGQIFAAARDVTDRVLIENELRREKNLNDAIFSSIPGMIYLYDENGRLVKWNKRHETMTGYSADELAQMTLLSWYKDDPVSQKAVTDGINVTLQTGFGEAEADLQTKWGTKLPMYFTASPVMVDDKPFFIGVGIEITERKRVQQALEKKILALTQPLDESQSVELEDLFNIQDIQLLQDQFADATGVASIITRIDGTPITRPSQFCRLCQEMIRSNPQGVQNCMKSDAVLGTPNVSGPTIRPCLSGGLWDAGASIAIEGKHIANWLIGQVRNEVQSEQAIRQYAAAIGIDPDDAAQAFNEVPSMSKERFENVAKALYTLAKQLSTVAYQNVQQARFISDRQQSAQDLKRQLDLEHIIMEISGEFISMPAEETDHAMNQAIARLGEFLGVDRAYIYHYNEDDGLYQSMAEWCAEGVPSVHLDLKNIPTHETPVFTDTILSGKIFIVDDASQLGDDSQAERNYTLRLAVLSCINLPIQVSGKVYGFLGFETTRDKRQWQVGEVDLLRMFAHRVGNKLERNQYEEEIHRLNVNLEQIVAHRTEQLLESNKELESFAYSISHDLRAPLRSINGFSAALQYDYQDVLDDSAKDYISRIRASATRMSDQIDGLLTLSRISRAKLDLKRIDLSDLAFVIVGNLRDNEPDRKIHVEIEKGIEVTGDERMLMSLMQNLIENAWKFTSTVPRAEIHIYKKTRQGCGVCVVEDNGVGFDMAYADKLFGVFQRLHSTTEFPGTGIGLATAFRIVQRHDGLIWADSEPGKGTKFLFTIGCKEDGVLR